jgi:head-tail adaptor
MTKYTVNPGEMRTRITFQQPTISKDAGGAQKQTWANVTSNPTVWSRWIYPHGQELVSSDAKKSSLRATVSVRYRADIQASWRILRADSTAWNIVAPPENVRDLNRWVEFVVEQEKGTV